jgi:hypothetical protein
MPEKVGGKCWMDPLGRDSKEKSIGPVNEIGMDDRRRIGAREKV